MARFSEADGPEAPPALPAEIEAALALGRLDGALGACRSATLRLFAAAQLRGMLIAALRQEGHAFTEQRFHAWFAHHLILQVAADHAQPLHRWLKAHLPSRTGAFFACRAEEAAIALDYARAAHGMGAHYCQSHSALVCDVVALTLTLPPAPADWQGLLPGPALPKSLADKLSYRLCHGDLRHARLDQQCLVRRGYDPCQIAHDLQMWCMASGAQG